MFVFCFDITKYRFISDEIKSQSSHSFPSLEFISKLSQIPIIQDSTHTTTVSSGRPVFLKSPYTSLSLTPLCRTPSLRSTNTLSRYITRTHSHPQATPIPTSSLNSGTLPNQSKSRARRDKSLFSSAPVTRNQFQ